MTQGRWSDCGLCPGTAHGRTDLAQSKETQPILKPSSFSALQLEDLAFCLGMRPCLMRHSLLISFPKNTTCFYAPGSARAG